MIEINHTGEHRYAVIVDGVIVAGGLIDPGELRPDHAAILIASNPRDLNSSTWWWRNTLMARRRQTRCRERRRKWISPVRWIKTTYGAVNERFVVKVERDNGGTLFHLAAPDIRPCCLISTTTASWSWSSPSTTMMTAVPSRSAPPQRAWAHIIGQTITSG